MVEFIDNYAEQNGGAVCLINSKGKFKVKSTVRYIDNAAKINGGATYFSRNSVITFDNDSTSVITFHNNEATQGGAVYSESNANITLGGQSKILFISNNATFGGAVY